MDGRTSGIAQVVLFASDMKAKIISEREKNRALEAEVLGKSRLQPFPPPPHSFLFICIVLASQLDSLAAHVQEETVRVAEERLALQVRGSVQRQTCL